MKRLLAILAVLLASFVLMGQTADAPISDPGEQIFKTICATCHTLDPPPEKAPPMRMVLRHYMEADLEDPWQAIRDWIPAPDSSRSALPAHAIERFGLMAPLSLPEEDLDAVIDYLKTLSEEEGEPMGGMKHGMGEEGMGEQGNGKGKHKHGKGMRH